MRLTPKALGRLSWLVLSSTLTVASIANAQVDLSGYKLVFDDEFNGTSYNQSKWTDSSSAEADGGHGNQGNSQLEWNQGKNCQVANGVLKQIAKRESFTSPSGRRYDWTSCLLTTSPSLTFQYGYIEERAKLPAPKGFWPAFWTWQAPGVNSWQETDVYEFYSDNHTRLYLTSHSGSGGGCNYSPPFDPSADFHTYGAMITPTGTTWYIDGVRICSASGSPSAKTNIITNLAVYAQIPPDASLMSATKEVDYIRAYSTDPSLPAVTPESGYNGPGAPSNPSPTPVATPVPTPKPTPEPSTPISGYRVIEAQNSHLCADVAGVSQQNSAPIVQYTCFRSPNQLFEVIPMGNNQYSFKAQHSGKCIELAGSSLNNGAPFVQWPCNGGANQRFRLKDMGSGNYSLISVRSGKCMDIQGNASSNSTPFIQWTCHGHSNQQFKLK